MYRMLYYPFVTPPRPVLLQALLYWDELSSIVPVTQGIRPELQRLGEFYTPVSVDDALGSDALDALVSELHTVLATVPPHKLRPDRGPISGGNRLYFGKLPHVIESELRDCGAVVEADGILKGSPEFLLPMLAITAKHLALASNQHSPDRVTVTNTDAAEAYGDAYDGRGALEVERCWLVQVGRLLPVPAGDVPIDEVFRFRMESAEQRDNLTRAVRALISQLQREYGEPYVPLELRHALTKAVAEYADARRRRKWSWASISASVVVGLGAAATALVPPVGAAALAGLSGLGFLVGGKDVRKGPNPNYTYLYDLDKRFKVFELA
jgi:hypothetical protein